MKTLLLLSAIFTLSFGTRISNPGSCDTLLGEVGDDGCFTSYNLTGTGEVVYEPPSENAVCDYLLQPYQGPCPRLEWMCRNLTDLFLPADFVYVTRLGDPILSINSTFLWFYPGQQLHWGEYIGNDSTIFQTGGTPNTAQTNQSRLCAETLGEKPNRRVIFSWVDILVYGRPIKTQIKFHENRTLEIVLEKFYAPPPRVGFENNYPYNLGTGPNNTYDGTAIRWVPNEDTTSSLTTTGSAPSTSTSTGSSGSCSNRGHMKCVSDNQYQVCDHGVWQSTQTCSEGLLCEVSGNYSYCVRPSGSSASSGTSTSSSSSNSSSGSNLCTSGHMRCTSEGQYQTCNRGSWGPVQSCSPQLKCRASDPYIYCV